MNITIFELAMETGGPIAQPSSTAFKLEEMAVNKIVIPIYDRLCKTSLRRLKRGKWIP